MKIVLIILALLLVFATALPILRFDQWWIRVFDFPRVQLAVAGLLLIALYLYFWESARSYDSLVLGVLVLAVIFQLVKIFPYTALMPKQVLDAGPGNPENRIRLLVANVLMENRESAAFLDLVRGYDPDVVLTVETDEWWEQALRPLEDAYPHTLKQPLENTYGMLVHSRLEMVNPEIRFILDDTIPSMQMQLVLASGTQIYVHFVHPDPPNPKHAMETTKRDAELLIVGREVDLRAKPTIIAGDLNDVAWSYTTSLFQKASGLLDPRIGRGMYNSYNAKSWFLRWPLDHVFHSEHFKLVHMERGPAWGSDHFPIFVELALESDAEQKQAEPETDQAEAEQVDEAIKDGRRQSDQ